MQVVGRVVIVQAVDIQGPKGSVLRSRRLQGDRVFHSFDGAVLYTWIWTDRAGKEVAREVHPKSFRGVLPAFGSPYLPRLRRALRGGDPGCEWARLAAEELAARGLEVIQ